MISEAQSPQNKNQQHAQTEAIICKVSLVNVD